MEISCLRSPFFVAEEERLQSLSTSVPRDLPPVVDAFKQVVLYNILPAFIVVLGREVSLSEVFFQD